MIHYVPPPKAQDERLKGFSSRDIPLPAPWANFSDISLTSRYPEKGFVLNQDCEMAVYIIDGAVLFESNCENVCLTTGASILVPRGHPYSWTPRDSVKMLIISNPPWYPEQQEKILG